MSFFFQLLLKISRRKVDPKSHFIIKLGSFFSGNILSGPANSDNNFSFIVHLFTKIRKYKILISFQQGILLLTKYQRILWNRIIEFSGMIFIVATDTKYFHLDRKSTRLNSSHVAFSYTVFFLKKKYTHI